MSDFPARDYLAHVVSAIARQLPSDYAHLLATDRYAEEAALLERLRDPEHLAQAVAALQPAEARWLAGRLLARWERLGEARLAPAVTIVGPDEVWLGDEPGKVTLSLATLGVEDGWEAQWLGNVRIAEDAASAQLTLAPPSGAGTSQVSIGVRVIGHSHGERCVLSAQHRIAVRFTGKPR